MLGEPMSREEIKDIIKVIDIDKDNRISIDEFIKFVRGD